MTLIKDVNFFVVDIETTGSHSKQDRITDIAAVQVKDGEIIDIFQSLVNPHKHIPEFIQNMTGITNELVSNAPEERDVLTEYRKFIDKENSVFVAHNANFDHYFIKHSVERLFGSSDFHDVICTVKLARKILPKTQKVNLTSLSEYYGIPIFMRHRALGDAFATAKALVIMLRTLENEHDIKLLSQLHNFIKKSRRRLKIANPQKDELLERISNVPMCVGIYKLYNASGEIIHQDIANNLHRKLSSLFDPNFLTSPIMQKKMTEVVDFEFLDTPTELHALLLLNRDNGDYKVEPKQMDLFNSNDEDESVNVVYIDPDNRMGKTVSIYFIRDGALIDHMDFGKNANTNIIDSALDYIYSNGNPKDNISPLEQETVKKWLSREPDLGNKFFISSDYKEVLKDIKNYIRSCY
jgi:DNA polymerase III epsilon subunit family exonuclease